MTRPWLRQWPAALFLLLLVNSAYLGAFSSPTIFYMGNVLVHVLLGAGLLGALVWGLLRRRSSGGPAAMGTLLASGAFGAYLAVVGNLTPQRWALLAHIALAGVGLLLLLPWARRRGGWFAAGFQTALALLVVLPLATYVDSRVRPDPRARIRNPQVVPVSMEEEGGGPHSPFWPSSTQTNVKGTVPSNFFLDSAQCGTCHAEIYRQWDSSVHHKASFNNQFYRKSIEYMQAVQGSTKPSQWCAGCHDHAVLFSGRWEKPIKDQIDTPEAQAGLACVSCHAISHVDGSTGNGGFTMEYNDLHDLAASRNPVIQALDRFLIYTDPEPHRKTFMKPFMREDASEYCAGCHKVHLDKPVNNYRWLRGFNDYDNWQASGVSGQGARSFYYPPTSATCSSCHMPLVAGKDPAAKNGKIHSHRFPGANTAVPYVDGDQEQLRVQEQFLKSGFISVDIFSASPVEDAKGEPAMVRRRQEGPKLMSTFAVGEEAESGGGAVFLREVGRVAAPLNATPTRFQPGETVRVDVVVRTRKIGHFFPGGTVDAFDVWLELEAKDQDGRVVFWSGQVEQDGQGPVERGAHFYRSSLLDGEGNPIDKRNAWQARSLLYVRLIPPGAADTVHYRLKIPKEARGALTLTAKLNYRKFAHSYTQFAYAGEPEEGQDPALVSVHHDSRRFSFAPGNVPANVSGGMKGRIPNLPIVTLAKAEATLTLAEPGVRTEWVPTVRRQDRERWNDWGIGMLLQGDLKGAEYAFQKVIEAEPEYADGHLNVARALIQEGETDAAKPHLAEALRRGPTLARVQFFRAMVQKADGEYDAALASLRTAATQYPRDRVVQNQIGRVLFLKREYGPAVEALQRVVAVDPEDVQAHYNLMLCYRGLGEKDKAAREEALFRRFKADESAQAITAKPRLLSPEDNNERQMIHDHESVTLPVGTPETPRSRPRERRTLVVRR